MDTTADNGIASGGTPPGLLERIRQAANSWARSQFELVILAAEFADSGLWRDEGVRSAAAWLARVADCETSTAREWIRVGQRLRVLPAIAQAFTSRTLSYAKVRTLTRVATAETEHELVDLAAVVSAGELSREVARWLATRSDPEALERYQHDCRSVRWRTDGDGMTRFTVLLPPEAAAALIAAIEHRVRESPPRSKDAEQWPTAAQQRADAFIDIATNGGGGVSTEVILHVRGDGATMDDGTPIPITVIERIAPHAFIRAMIHDAERNPINVSSRHRHPTDRQKRVVKERDAVCIDCGRADLLTYDHNPDFHTSKRTVVDELELRCAPCHWERHRRPPSADRDAA